MEKIFTVLVERLGLLLLAAAAVALLHYYGDLSFRTSVLLGIAVAIVGLWLYGLYEFASFKPYRLVIGVDYGALWEDLNLTPAEGPKFDNVTFTAISPAIYARSDDRGYSRILDFSKNIPCGAPTWSIGPGEINDSPTFFLRPARGGYQFGVLVQQEWWKQHSRKVVPPLSGKPLAFSTTLLLGLLPYGFVPEHVRHWNEPISLWYRFDHKQRRWKELLKQEGWTFDDNYPTHIHHRYLGIGYYDL